VESTISYIKQNGNVPIKKTYDLTLAVKQLDNGKGIIRYPNAHYYIFLIFHFSPSAWNSGFLTLSRFLNIAPSPLNTPPTTATPNLPPAPAVPPQQEKASETKVSIQLSVSSLLSPSCLMHA
jgi:hypothetical protein